jgi:dipeptidyl-peptidase III
MYKYFLAILCSIALFACNSNNKSTTTKSGSTGYDDNFKGEAESFADLQILRYQVPGFDQLTAKEKELCYYLYEAALCGRDIIYDQKSKHGIYMRKVIENIYGTYSGDKKDSNWKKWETYCGRFWFSNGNFHHYGNEKFIPECSYDYFLEIYNLSDTANMPKVNGITDYKAFNKKLFYDLKYQPKCVNQASGVDNVATSSNNFYEGVTQAEVDSFYARFPAGDRAPSWGLNSKVIKENGVLKERVWKSGSMYGTAIDKICYWLDKAAGVAENPQQQRALLLLAKYYRSGNLKDFDEYSIAWVKDTASKIDVVNGFIEVYLDAIGKKGSYESVVSIKDIEATKRIKAIADNAQWFEDNSPLMPEHKKKKVVGITAKAITVVVESGDAAPSTPIGVNLPNADWIRKDSGSKSVSLSNIIHSYNVPSAKRGILDEFGYDATVIARIKKYGALGSDLHTDMHECIGHASGQINDGVATTDITLKNYASCLEEARADLVGLYFILDKKLIDIKVMPNMDVAQAQYDNYMMNGLMTQLTRIKLGDNIEEAHMRNRQLNARWVYEKGKKDSVVVLEKRDGKTFVKIKDYEKLRTLFGELLREIQRIKSEGDFKAGQALVETYGVKVDKVLHKEILDRYATLNLKPYRGFIQPVLTAEMDGDKVKDVKISYPTSFFEQMMNYGKQYALLPILN